MPIYQFISNTGIRDEYPQAQNGSVYQKKRFLKKNKAHRSFQKINSFLDQNCRRGRPGGGAPFSG